MLKPFKLFDVIKDQHAVHTDAALAGRLRLAPPQVSKVRSGYLPCSDMVILRVHEAFGMPVADIRAMLKEAPAEAESQAAEGAV